MTTNEHVNRILGEPVEPIPEPTPSPVIESIDDTVAAREARTQLMEWAGRVNTPFHRLTIGVPGCPRTFHPHLRDGECVKGGLPV